MAFNSKPGYEGGGNTGGGGSSAPELIARKKYTEMLSAQFDKDLLPFTGTEGNNANGNAVAALIPGKKAYIIPQVTPNMGEFYEYDLNTYAVRKLEIPSLRRTYSTQIVIGSKIYFVGGYKAPSVLSNDVDVYDTETNTWSQLPPMPNARRGSAVALVNNKIYAIGGQTAAVDSYDLSTGEWTTETPLPAIRHSAISITVGTKIYVFGGYTTAYQKDVLMYDTEALSWTTKTAMPSNLNHNFAGYQDSVVIPSFDDPSKFLLSNSPNLIFDPVTETVTTGALVFNKFPTNGQTLAYWSEGSDVKLMTIVGPSTKIPTIFKLDRTGNGIVQNDYLLKQAPQYARIGDILYVLGGITNTGHIPEAHTKVYSINVITGEKKILASYPLALHSVAFCADDNGKYIYAIGGRDGTSGYVPSAKCFRYDIVNDSWSPIADMPVAKFNVVAYFANGKVYTLYGMLTSNSSSGTRYEYDPVSDSWKSVLPQSNNTIMQNGGYVNYAPGPAMAIEYPYLITCLSTGTTKTQMEIYDLDSNQIIHSWTNGTITRGTDCVIGAFIHAGIAYFIGTGTTPVVLAYSLVNRAFLSFVETDWAISSLSLSDVVVGLGHMLHCNVVGDEYVEIISPFGKKMNLPVPGDLIYTADFPKNLKLINGTISILDGDNQPLACFTADVATAPVQFSVFPGDKIYKVGGRRVAITTA